MGLIARKPVFGVSAKASFKPVSSATETSKKTEISPVASLHIILSKKRITKALIRLRGCAGWSAPVLFANSRRQVFSRRGPFNGEIELTVCLLVSPQTVWAKIRPNKTTCLNWTKLFDILMVFLKAFFKNN